MPGFKPANRVVRCDLGVKGKTVRWRGFGVVTEMFIWLFSMGKKAINVRIIIEFVAFPVDGFDILERY
jgi:hypothetical protein